MAIPISNLKDLMDLKVRRPYVYKLRNNNRPLYRHANRDKIEQMLFGFETSPNTGYEMYTILVQYYTEPREPM